MILEIILRCFTYMSWQFLKKRIQIIPLSIDTNYCKVYNPFFKSLRGCFLSQVSCFLWIFELSHCCVLQNMWWINKQRNVCIVIHILLPLQRFILLVNYNNRTFFFFSPLLLLFIKNWTNCVWVLYTYDGIKMAGGHRRNNFISFFVVLFVHFQFLKKKKREREWEKFT